MATAKYNGSIASGTRVNRMEQLMCVASFSGFVSVLLSNLELHMILPLNSYTRKG